MSTLRKLNTRVLDLKTQSAKRIAALLVPTLHQLEAIAFVGKPSPEFVLYQSWPHMLSICLHIAAATYHMVFVQVRYNSARVGCLQSLSEMGL